MSNLWIILLYSICCALYERTCSNITVKRLFAEALIHVENQILLSVWVVNYCHNTVCSNHVPIAVSTLVVCQQHSTLLGDKQHHCKKGTSVKHAISLVCAPSGWKNKGATQMHNLLQFTKEKFVSDGD